MANVKIDHDYKLCVFDVKISCCWSEKHSRACAVDVSDDNDASGVLVSSSSSSRYIPGICRNGAKWVDYDFIILSSFYLFVFHKQQDLFFSTKQSYVAIHLRLVYQWMNPSYFQPAKSFYRECHRMAVSLFCVLLHLSSIQSIRARNTHCARSNAFAILLCLSTVLIWF